jgi:GTPase
MHFHRSRQTSKGGPDGGDGGRGGHIIIRGNRQLWTLLHLKYRKHIIAEPGGSGGAALRHGANGDDVIIEVPLGTVVRDAETNEIEMEITEDGEERILTPGGRGGLGNDHFKSATNQTPRYAQPGEEGREEWKILELKLLADVGLVGFPNAGKSTLLSVVSAAKPEIANYPFTTLVPNLGIVGYRGDRSFVMADIPGIIEGAHAGKGLGVRFLRHIERNSTLLFLVPADTTDIVAEYKILLNELQLFNPELLDKKRVLGISKTDLLDEELFTSIKADLEKKLKEAKVNIPVVYFSSHTTNGITELKDILWRQLNS